MLCLRPATDVRTDDPNGAGQVPGFATWIKRKLYEFSTYVGYKVANLKFDKKAGALLLEGP